MILVLVVGCIIVLKFLEIVLFLGFLFVEMMDEVGFLVGVFNFVNGDGMGVGS